MTITMIAGDFLVERSQWSAAGLSQLSCYFTIFLLLFGFELHYLTASQHPKLDMILYFSEFEIGFVIALKQYLSKFEIGFVIALKQYFSKFEIGFVLY